jgi:hypothetical protein
MKTIPTTFLINFQKRLMETSARSLPLASRHNETHLFLALKF